MFRQTNSAECRKITDQYPDYFTFDANEWFSKPSNFAYQEDENIAFGEEKGEGRYWVHFCFHTARGREAINLTRKMLSALYQDTKFKSAIGLIAEDNKRARWLIRQVGFQSLGLVDTGKNGICEMFLAPKEGKC